MLKQLNTGGHDLEQVKEIYQSVGWHRPNRDWDRLMRSHEKSDFAVGWYEGDQLVGYITALSDGLYVFVSTLIVHSDFQGQGIGKALIAILEERYPEHRITLTTKRARAFYEGLGFQPSAQGIEKDTTGEG